MKTRSFRNWISAGVIALFLPVFVQASDAVGTWKWSLPSPNTMPVEVTLTIEDRGGALTGTYLESGKETVPVDVSLDGNTLSFTVENSAIGTAKYIGRMEAGVVDGLITVVKKSEEVVEPIAWTATKALVPERLN